MLANSRLTTVMAAAITAALLVPAREARAHCDTMGGPVVVTAKAALEKGDVTPVLKWVRPDKEDEIRAVFGRSLAVRKLSPEAREVADTYFLETLVRIHREGEGASYTGLKPAGDVDPAVAMADKALAGGNVDQLAGALSRQAVEGIRARFARAYEAKKHADESVSAGREYVEAYVLFTHYVERLHGDIAAAPQHHGDARGEAAPGHRH